MLGLYDRRVALNSVDLIETQSASKTHFIRFLYKTKRKANIDLYLDVTLCVKKTFQNEFWAPYIRRLYCTQCTVRKYLRFQPNAQKRLIMGKLKKIDLSHKIWQNCHKNRKKENKIYKNMHKKLKNIIKLRKNRWFRPQHSAGDQRDQYRYSCRSLQ